MIEGLPTLLSTLNVITLAYVGWMIRFYELTWYGEHDNERKGK